MQYVLEPAFEETGAVVIEVGGLQDQMVGPALSSRNHEVSAKFYGITATQKDVRVKGMLLFYLRSFCLQIQINDGVFVTVKTTPDALNLRSHLLGQTFLFWHSKRELDFLSQEMLVIFQAGLAEMARIEKLQRVPA